MAYWGSHPSQYWVLYQTGVCALDSIASHLAAVKATYDPDNRLTSLYDKAVRRR